MRPTMNAQSASAKELFVLGMLSIRPSYGHELMRALAESRADLWVELSEKHVYYILKKLEREGLVDVEVQHEGAGPSRKVFSATPAGLVEFERLIRAGRLIESMPYSEFDVVFGMLVYSDRLTHDEKTDILLRRAAHLRAVVRDVSEARERAAIGGAPNPAARVFERLTRVADAELAWLEEVLADIGRDGWPAARGAAVSLSEGSAS